MASRLTTMSNQEIAGSTPAVVIVFSSCARISRGVPSQTRQASFSLPTFNNIIRPVTTSVKSIFAGSTNPPSGVRDTTGETITSFKLLCRDTFSVLHRLKRKAGDVPDGTKHRCDLGAVAASKDLEGTDADILVAAPIRGWGAVPVLALGVDGRGGSARHRKCGTWF